MSAGLQRERIGTALRVALGALLGYQALAFLLAGRAAFARLGYPDAARVALGTLELLAALSIVHPRTFLAGAVGLIGTLSWAAGFHFALRARAWPLLVGVALVALLLALRSPVRGAKETA